MQSRLRGCAGWSAPLLFANHQGQVFSRRGPVKERMNFSEHRYISGVCNIGICVMICVMTWHGGYETFFMLNTTDHEISTARKN